MSNAMSKLKSFAPILILIIPLLFLLGILFDSRFNMADEEYEPVGEVTYSLTSPEEHGLTDDEYPAAYDTDGEDPFEDETTE